METLLGTRWDIFLAVTVALGGGIAFMMGQAIARTWRPAWQAVGYGMLLAVTTRFFIYALFDGRMLLLSGYLIDAVVLVGLALIAFRLTRVSMMVNQYPWLYERAGPFAYREL